MSKNSKNIKIIMSGGGTGGHIFPALAIANTLKNIHPDAEILFVGAKGRMEMQKIPAAGYPIEGLWISGINRHQLWKNMAFPFKLISSILNARRIINNFKPDVVIGTGGFASGPLLYMAQKKGIPTFIQEQNSYPGITNKLLAKNAHKIYTAYDNLESYFPVEKIVKTGNPIRKGLDVQNINKNEALKQFGLHPDKKTILVTGGSLGAAPINKAIANNLDRLKESNYQLIWQTGQNHFEKYRELENEQIKVMPFINRMQDAYAAADLIISRAGAGAISELAVVGKPVILVPSPYVAEDHQTKNAQALSTKEAAILMTEKDLNEKLIPAIQSILEDENLANRISENIQKMAMPDAAEKIVNDILQTLKNREK